MNATCPGRPCGARKNLALLHKKSRLEGIHHYRALPCGSPVLSKGSGEKKDRRSQICLNDWEHISLIEKGGHKTEFVRMGNSLKEICQAQLSRSIGGGVKRRSILVDAKFSGLRSPEETILIGSAKMVGNNLK